jgi:membrane-associated phospholipid phosphatase
VYDVDGYFVYGAALLIVFIALVLLSNPKQLPFTLYSLALFFFIRAIFISLTHLAPFPIHTPIEFTSNVGIFLSHLFFSGDDLFFSAHTGVPFLMALVFWRQPILRYIFLLWSIFFAVVVLLGHIHYSIDVASAFFISFGIYHITMWIFSRAHGLFLAEL